ncbi:hypothetical protein ACQP0C_00920 [Nocardia sp. CA-129566]|uniref:hypothetical protein n=1 Tax=Nocardia sp. CA-129566 TaxID=3239976 RepID=UPI003D958366
MMLAAADVTTAVVSSAVVAAIVGAVSSFFTQRYLLVRKAQLDADAMDRQARIAYESMARQRLYEAIGPLRMQLLYSARDAIHRIVGHVRAGMDWNMDPSADYGRSTIYRLLCPLAVAQLIERAVGAADFSVDAGALGLLRFGATSERMLSSDNVVLDHPDVDWARQTQHLFRDNLRAAAARLIDDDHDRPIVISYDRFLEEVPDPARDPELEALAAILSQCSRHMGENPLFWLRLVGYAYACGELVRTQGVPLGFATPTIDPAMLLRKTGDEYISRHIDDYVAAMRRVADEGL